MSVDMRSVQRKLVNQTVDGIGLYIIEKGLDKLRLSAYEIEKNLKQYSKPALMIGVSLVDVIYPQINRMPYFGDWFELTGKVGVKEAIKQIVDKPAYVVADDANTLHGYNFDNLTNLEVWVDGTKLASGTDYTVTGTASDFTISLTNPLASGEHDVVITDGKKAFEGKIKV